MGIDEKNICKNCGTEYFGSHCPNCGQAANVERFTVKGTLRELYMSFSVGDNTFYRTAKSLLYRPGHMVREYLIGERQKYLKPIKMLMVLVAVYIIITNLLITGESQGDIFLRNEISKYTFLGSAATYVIAFFQNKVYGSLFSALLCTIPFTWVFRKCKIAFKEKNAKGEPVEYSLNLAEHFYTVVYISCQLMLITYIEIPFRFFFGYELGNNEGVVINILLYVICYKQLLGISWLKSLWKVILGMILMSLLYFAILVVIFLIVGIFDPSVFTLLHR